MKSGTARRLRGAALDAPHGDMDTVVCGKCGQRFAIHNDGLRDAVLAEKQVAWVEDQLVWDHIQERKHHGSMELPALGHPMPAQAN